VPDETDQTFLNPKFFYTGFTIGDDYEITIRCRESSSSSSNKLFMSGSFYPDPFFGIMPLHGTMTTFTPSSPPPDDPPP